jgi:hypothetical protein
VLHETNQDTQEGARHLGLIGQSQPHLCIKSFSFEKKICTHVSVQIIYLLTLVFVHLWRNGFGYLQSGGCRILVRSECNSLSGLNSLTNRVLNKK